MRVLPVAANLGDGTRDVAKELQSRMDRVKHIAI
jgi:hypothetical protein